MIYRIRVETNKKGIKIYYPEMKKLAMFKWFNWWFFWLNISGVVIVNYYYYTCEKAQAEIEKHKKSLIDKKLSEVIKTTYIEDGGCYNK